MIRNAALLALAGTALLSGSAFGQAIEVRIGSNPVLGSGTFFSGLYDVNGNLTNVPQAATGFNPAVPFSGTILVGDTFVQGAGQTTVNINNTGVYPGPTYTGFGTTVSGFWMGVIHIANGFVAPGSYITCSLDGPFGGDVYTASLVPGSASFNASGVNTWTVQGATFHGNFTNPHFGGVDVTPWFLGQLIGPNLEGSVINVGGNAAGTGDGIFNTTMTTTAIIPLPSAALAGLGTMAGIAGFGAIRRRRNNA